MTLSCHNFLGHPEDEVFQSLCTFMGSKSTFLSEQKG